MEQNLDTLKDMNQKTEKMNNDAADFFKLAKQLKEKQNQSMQEKKITQH